MGCTIQMTLKNRELREPGEEFSWAANHGVGAGTQ